MLRHADPSLFDQEMKRHGIDTRSYNAGVEGAGGYEIDAIIENILETTPSELKRVFIILPNCKDSEKA